uniref:Ribosomal protein S10 n=1 Tax=Medakamo hakoo TaxID=3113649 RepID=A0A8E4DH56_9CHLO|nr:ribosomal protein S10 [Medakamo hakoo]
MNHKLIISFKSNNHAHISHGQNKIQNLFNELNNSNKVNSLVSLPNQKTYITVLRSPHIDKKSREQFVYKTSKANISFIFPDAKSLDLFIFALNQIEIPGVELKITTKEWKYLSV